MQPSEVDVMVDGAGEGWCQAVFVNMGGGRIPSKLMVKFRDTNELIFFFLFQI